MGWRLGSPLRARGTVVLMYHRVGSPQGLFPGLDIALFAEHMRWLRRHCTPIALPDLKESVQKADPRRPPVLVTFDDGHRDFHDVAYPILKELGIPAVVFLATALMDEGGLLWTDRVDLALRRCSAERLSLPWADEPVDLSNDGRRAKVVSQAKSHLKRVPDAERRRLVDLLFSTPGIVDPLPSLPRQMLSWDEVRATGDLTVFGGHTHTHPILPRLGPREQEEEIRRCRDRIEAETGRVPTAFAYPNGDFDGGSKEALRRVGFDIAFTSVEGVNLPDVDWLEVKRVPGYGDLSQFAWVVSGRDSG